MTSLVDAFVSHQADDRPALTCDGRTTSWSSVVSESVTRAEILGQFLDFSRSPQFAVFVDDAREYVLWLGAALLSGSCLVGLDPLHPSSTTAAILQSSTPQIVVFDDPASRRLSELGIDETSTVDLESNIHLAFMGSQSSSPAALSNDAYPLCSLTVDSQEHGPSTLFMTEAQIDFAAHQVARATEMTKHEICYDTMPFGCANSVLAIWSPAVITGAEIVVGRSFSPKQFLLDVQEFNCTYFTFAGSMIQELLDLPRSPIEVDLRLHVGFGTGSTPDQRRDFLQRFGCELVDADQWHPKSMRET